MSQGSLATGVAFILLPLSCARLCPLTIATGGNKDNKTRQQSTLIPFPFPPLWICDCFVYLMPATKRFPWGCCRKRTHKISGELQKEKGITWKESKQASILLEFKWKFNSISILHIWQHLRILYCTAQTSGNAICATSFQFITRSISQFFNNCAPLANNFTALRFTQHRHTHTHTDLCTHIYIVKWLRFTPIHN